MLLTGSCQEGLENLEFLAGFELFNYAFDRGVVDFIN